MRSQWFERVPAVALGGLLICLAAVADADQRRPKGETSSASGKSSAAVRAPQESSPPPRRAVPRAQSDDEAPRARSRRAPRRDDDRADRHYHGRGYWYPIYRGPYSYHPWDFWWGPYFGFYPPYPWGYGTYWYPERMHEGMGALDLDLKPEEAEVYLDGYKIGIADNFDGWPRYLWLEEGTYDVVFHHEGFETIARQYTIYPGVVIDVEDRMRRGEAVLPEDLVERSTARREERLRRREERGEPTGRPAAWRDRIESERAAMADEAIDARGEPARLRLDVVPGDAAVYLDGRFLGTGDEIAGVRAGLIVDPGDHEIEISRPGYRTETRTFTAEAGDEVELEVELEGE